MVELLGSLAIFSLFTWLVPHVSVEVGEFIRSIELSPHWSRSNERLQAGYDAIQKAAMQALMISLVVISLTAVAISQPTDGIDPNMVSIIEGFSAFMASIVFLILSIKAAKWIGLYHSAKLERHLPVGKTAQVLRFHVRWGLYRLFGVIYFPMLPLFCGAKAFQNVIIPAMIGVACGLVLDAFIYFGRRDRSALTAFFQLLFMTMLAYASSILFMFGVRYVYFVWKKTDKDLKFIISTVSFGGWTLVILIVHACLWKFTQIKRGQEASEDRGVYRRKRVSMTNQRTFASMYYNHIGNKRQEEQNETPPTEEGVVDAEDGGDSLEIPEGEERSNGNGRVPSSHNRAVPSSPLPDDEENEKLPPSKELAEDHDRLDDDEEERLWVIAVRKLSCREPNAREKTLLEKITTAFLWISWIILCFLFLYFVVLNIGAQAQIRSTEAKLPAVQEILYTHQNEGEVCAFDNQLPDPTIKTFANKDEAHAAGFLILHCGACSHCSDWHNLEKEWSTRDYLAAESGRCAKKSLLGGEEAVNDCILEEPIGFRGECARCWTTDIMCTTKHCAFIFLQSQIINKVSDFQVAPGQITSAACEEAHCEVGQFVPCSGANRRRMNIQSSIPRPPEQLCKIVDVDWSELFTDCCTLDDYACPFGERCQANRL